MTSTNRRATRKTWWTAISSVRCAPEREDRVGDQVESPCPQTKPECDQVATGTSHQLPVLSDSSTLLLLVCTGERKRSGGWRRAAQGEKENPQTARLGGSQSRTQNSQSRS
jgi:hypothetical protein